jgi:hypothetical protein
LNGYRTQDNFINAIIGEDVGIISIVEMVKSFVSISFGHMWRKLTEIPMRIVSIRKIIQ